MTLKRRYSYYSIVIYVIGICVLFYGCRPKLDKIKIKKFVPQKEQAEKMKVPSESDLMDKTTEALVLDTTDFFTRETPFVPLDKEIEIKALEKYEFKLESLVLKGILKNTTGYTALFKDSNDGSIYMTRNGHLINKKREIVEEITVKNVNKDSVILQREQDFKKYFISGTHELINEKEVK